MLFGKTALTVPGVPIAGVKDPAGNDLWLNGQPKFHIDPGVLAPAGNGSVPAKGAVGSGIPLDDKPKPYKVRFTSADTRNVAYLRVFPSAVRVRGAVIRKTLLCCALAALVAAGALASPAAAAKRVYWVAAVPRTWNVVPNGRDALFHTPVDAMAARVQAFTYQRFTRGFARRMPNDTAGLVGPLIRARVGDDVVVHFRNLDLENPHSMHFHAFHYKPSSDGAFLPGFSGPDANVKPGRDYTYRLHAGADSVGVWPYHDHSPSMMESIDGGEYGVLSILGRHERAPDRENIVFFGAMAGFNTIDGRAFVGNTPVFHSITGDLVQWDVLNLGDDFHTFHVHGHRWLENGHPRDTRQVGPAESFRIRFRERAPGTWFYHCHVESHMMNGMIGLYRVRSTK